MKIRFEFDGKVLEYEKRPMRSSRFRTICKLIAAGIYGCTVAAVASICGITGLLIVAVVTVLAGAGYVATTTF